MWGNNDCGQLGLGQDPKFKDFINIALPIEVLPPKGCTKYLKVACGVCHVLAIAENDRKQGKLYSWGHNKYGQCG